jgi:LysM repeat protein
MVTYVVQIGDTLSGIAARFGVGTLELARVNGILNPHLIYWGQWLVIPTRSATPFPTAVVTRQPTSVPPTATPVTSGQTYRVQYGDNLYRISLRFNVPVAALVQANRLSNPNRIYVGQLLVIP